MNNAPKEIIEKEKSKQIDWQNNLNKLKELLNNIN